MSSGIRCGVFGASIMLIGMALASTPAAAEAAKCAGNPLVGAWRLDAAKSKMDPDSRIPGRFAVIASSGADGITALFVSEGDAPSIENWTVQFDGKAYAVRGVYPRQMQWHRTDCNDFDFVTLRQVVFDPVTGSVKQYFAQPQTQSNDRIVVSADGKVLTDTHSVMGSADEILVFNRQ